MHLEIFKNFEIENTERETGWSKYLTNFCQKFKQYFIIIHIDDTTQRSLDIFLKNITGFIIFNYSKKIPNLPHIGLSLNIVFMKDIVRFEPYCRDHKWTSDVFVFIEVGSILVSSAWFLTGTKQPIKLFIVYFQEDVVDLYQFLGVPKHMMYIGKSNFTDMNTIPDSKVNEIIKNFNGYKFNIAYVEYFPYIWYNKNNTVTGAHIRILDIISKKLNFTYCFHRYQNYSQMMKDLTIRKTNFAVGAIRISSQRKMYYHMINIDYQYIPIIYFPHKNILSSLSILTSAFRIEVWIMMIFTFCFLTFVFYMVYGKYFHKDVATPEWSLQVSKNI